MQLKIYQVDAFASQPFRGNPAAVVPLAGWLADDVLQDIAMENNLSETAYFVGSDGRYRLRWFTPVEEVNLCGHATLASAWVLFNELGEKAGRIAFDTRSGELLVTRQGDGYVLDFPVQPPQPCAIPAGLAEALGAEIVEAWAAEDYLVLVDDERTVRNLRPDFSRLRELPLRGLIVTARGDSADFVSRWFGPKLGIDEDPVTGSAHTTLAPYWANKLGKTDLTAEQVSRRGGKLGCTVADGRVLISGTAVKFMEGVISLGEG